MFMDLYFFEEELNFEKLISPKVYNQNINVELKNYLKNEYSYYMYCLSELKIHFKHNLEYDPP